MKEIYQVIGYRDDSSCVAVFGTYSNIYSTKKKLSMIIYEKGKGSKWLEYWSNFYIERFEVDKGE